MDTRISDPSIDPSLTNNFDNLLQTALTLLESLQATCLTVKAQRQKTTPVDFFQGANPFPSLAQECQELYATLQALRLAYNNACHVESQVENSLLTETQTHMVWCNELNRLVSIQEVWELRYGKSCVNMPLTFCCPVEGCGAQMITMNVHNFSAAGGLFRLGYRQKHVGIHPPKRKRERAKRQKHSQYGGSFI